jgi:hypothetical protein
MLVNLKRLEREWLVLVKMEVPTETLLGSHNRDIACRIVTNYSCSIKNCKLKFKWRKMPYKERSRSRIKIRDKEIYSFVIYKISTVVREVR